jgi:pimeloyl-ACP methyl ester carboxylesterase
MEEFFLEKRGIYYRRNEFEQDRLTLFFVHGVSGSSSAWLPYEEELYKEYNIISIDLRGHGKSSKPARYEDYTIEKFSDDLYELLLHVNIETCILISNSFGSLVALEFIAQHRDMISATIFIGPHFVVGEMMSARLVRPLLMLAVKIKPSFSPSALHGGHIDYSKYKNTGDWNMRIAFANIKNTGLWVYLYTTAQSYAFNGKNNLKNIMVPTLIIHGANDTIFPLKYGVMMAMAIPNAKIVILDDIDHIVVLNRSAEVVGLIKKFVGGLGKKNDYISY